MLGKHKGKYLGNKFAAGKRNPEQRETIRKAVQSFYDRGGSSWCKGLTKDNDTRVLTIAQKRMGQKRPAMSVWKKNWWITASEERIALFLKRWSKSCKIKPNKPEQILLKFINSITDNTYKYVGDGNVVLGKKIPDFININGQKKIIELFGDYWHKNDNPQDRINHFKKYGWDCLVIWERELKETDKLKNKILSFNGGIL